MREREREGEAFSHYIPTNDYRTETKLGNYRHLFPNETI